MPNKKITEAYRAIKAKADEIGWPEHYQTDLTHHNRIRLSRKDAPETFLWALRPKGTHLLELDNPVEAWRALSIYQMWPNARWFFWHSEAGMGYLRKITWSEVLTRISNALRGFHVLRRDGHGEHKDAGEIIEVTSDVVVTQRSSYTRWDLNTVELAVCAFNPTA